MRRVTLKLNKNQEEKQRIKEQRLEAERLEAENRLEEIIEEQLVGKNEKERLDFIHTFALVMDEYGGLDSYINFVTRKNKNKNKNKNSRRNINGKNTRMNINLNQNNSTKHKRYPAVNNVRITQRSIHGNNTENTSLNAPNVARGSAAQGSRI
jgi:hypothetical protein